MRRPSVRTVLLAAAVAMATSGLSAFAATAPDPEPTSRVIEASEPPAKPDKAAKPAKADKAAKAAKADKAAKATGRKARGRATAGHGRANAHGKAVSAAARGDTPPVGDCRNHGHWVSTVATGGSSCDDNPRPAAGRPGTDD